MKRIAYALVLVGLWIPSAYGVDVILVDDDFESYADDTALFNEWFDPGVGNFGLVDENFDPDAFPQGGQGAVHVGGPVADWIGFDDPIQQPPLVPSETQSVVVRGDVYDDGLGNASNKRMTIGLRGITPGASNLLELGFYNSNSCDPTVCGPGEAGGTDAPQNAVDGDPGFYPGTAYGYRIQLFSGIADPLLVQPDWQYFQLPTELDRSPPGNPIGDYNENDLADAADYTVWRDSLGQSIALPNEDPEVTPGEVTEEDYAVWRDNFGADGPPGDGLINPFDVGPGWHRYQATIRPDEITLEIDLYRDGLRNTSMTPDEMTGIRPGTPGVDASVTWPVTSTLDGYDSLRIGGPSNLSSAGGGLIYDNLFLALIDVPLVGSASGQAVPEPSAVTLALLALMALAAGRRGRV